MRSLSWLRPGNSGWLGLALSLLATSPALAADVRHGKELADRWCVLCHVVSEGQTSAPADNAPSFMWLANSGKSDAALRSFLVAPHPPMPNLDLSRREIDDVIAYIRTLKTAE